MIIIIITTLAFCHFKRIFKKIINFFILYFKLFFYVFRLF
jgi:hypothetical protein